MLFYTLVILAIIICVLLGLLILIQEPKGGGLTSGFAGSSNIIGVQRAGDLLEKGTWILTISLMVIVLLINVVIPKGGDRKEKTFRIKSENLLQRLRSQLLLYPAQHVRLRAEILQKNKLPGQKTYKKRLLDGAFFCGLNFPKPKSDS